MEAAGQKALGVEALEVRDASLQHDRRDNMASVAGEQISKTAMISKEPLQE